MLAPGERYRNVGPPSPEGGSLEWSDLDGDGCDTHCEVLEDELVASVPELGGTPGYLLVRDLQVFFDQ